MKSVLIAITIATLGWGGSASASTLIGKCLLVVDQVTYLQSSRCFIDMQDDGSFSIGTDGTHKYFAYANTSTDGMYGYWNGEQAGSHADQNLGPLEQEQITRPNGSIEKSGCWVNERTKICAWK